MPLILSGFRYERLSGAMSVQQRLNWLRKKDERELPVELTDPLTNCFMRFAQALRDPQARNFEAQPYTHLAKVFREQGVTRGAARVLHARDQLISRAGYQRALTDSASTGRRRGVLAAAMVRRSWEKIFDALFGFGHFPGRAFGALFACWLYGLALFGQAYATHQMAPNSDVVLTSADWLAAVEAGCPATTEPDYAVWKAQCAMPLSIWLERSRAAPDYETFSAGLYALDLFIPLDALGQEAAWAPSKDRGFWGWLGYWSRMPVQLAGWIITAVGAAALAGLVGRRD